MKTIRTVTAGIAVSALALTAACGSSAAKTVGTQPGKASNEAASELRLGYVANVTHATAVYGIATGGFQQALGATKLKASVFSAGPSAIEALRGGGLDAAFLGPNPAVNGFAQTKGKLLRIVAGTTSGGAALVTRPSITSVEQLAGKKIATPQLGNTQDVAAKSFFKSNNVKVTVVNQESSQTLELFKTGQIDGGWVPEPWASRLVLDGGGKVLVDEKTLWPAGQFVTTQLVVRKDYLDSYPGTVQALLKGLIVATATVATKSDAVQTTVNNQLNKDTGKSLEPRVLAAAFAHLTPTLDPIARSLATSAKNAQAIGLLKPVELKGIYDLTILNRLLAAAGRPAVSDADLGS